jgi:hypothetical protein
MPIDLNVFLPSRLAGSVSELHSSDGVDVAGHLVSMRNEFLRTALPLLQCQRQRVSLGEAETGPGHVPLWTAAKLDDHLCR